MRRALPAYTVPEPEPGGPIWACQRIRLTAGGGVCGAPAAAVKGKAGIPGTPYSNSGDTILNSCRRREGVIEAWHGAYRAGSGEGPPAPVTQRGNRRQGSGKGMVSPEFLLPPPNPHSPERCS